MYLDKQLADPFSIRWLEEAKAALHPLPGTHIEGTDVQLQHLAQLSKNVFIPYGIVGQALACRELEEFTSLLTLACRFGMGGTFLESYGTITATPRQSVLPVIAPAVRSFINAGDRGGINPRLLQKAFIYACSWTPAALSGSGTPDRIRNTLELFTRIIVNIPGTLERILGFHAFLYRTYPYDTAKRWFERGMSLLVPGKNEEAALFFKLQSSESRSMLGMASSVLEEMRNSLTIFAGSIAGGPAAIYSNEHSFTGSRRPYTDGAGVYLPPTITYFSSPEINNRAYTALTAQQCALMKYGSYRFSLEGFKDEYPDLLEEVREKYALMLPDIMEHIRLRYSGEMQSVRERPTGEIELIMGDRTILLLETPHEKFFFMFPFPYLAKELFSFLESARVSYLLSREYPGLKRDIEQVSGALWEKQPRLEFDNSRISAVGRAVLSMIPQISLAGQGKIPLRKGIIVKAEDRICSIFEKVRRPEATVHTTMAAVYELYSYFHETFPIETILGEKNIAEFFDLPGCADIYPEAVANTKPEYFGEGFTLERRERAATGADQEIDLTALTSNRSEKRYLEEFTKYGKTEVFRYNEYDINSQAYKKDHVTVLSRILPPGQGNTAGRILNRYSKIYSQIKKRFLMLHPEEVEVTRKWPDGEELHVDDCFDYFTSIAMKDTPDDKVYMTKTINRRDICAAILLDSSSSTASTLPGGSIIEIELASMILLGHALHFIGDSFGMFSFQSRGRRQVFVHTVKDFEDPWNTGVMSRIDSITPAFSNRDGAAIRHVTSLMDERPNKTKLLLILSDGIPADPGYGAKSGDAATAYSIEDTRKAVIEARKKGIYPYCITIDREAKEYIPRLYGQYSHTIIPDISSLPKNLHKLYAKITR